MYWNCWPFLDDSAHFMYVNFLYKFNKLEEQYKKAKSQELQNWGILRKKCVGACADVITYRWSCAPHIIKMFAMCILVQPNVCAHSQFGPHDKGK